jgi:hypothetical protein
MIWGILKGKLNWSIITPRARAAEALQRAWDEMPQSWIDALCKSFPRRVEMVGEAHGRTIQPLISAHQTLVPGDHLRDAPPVNDSPWNDQEDELLRELNGGPEPKNWGEMGRDFELQSVKDLKRRVRQTSRVQFPISLQMRDLVPEIERVLHLQLRLWESRRC